MFVKLKHKSVLLLLLLFVMINYVQFASVPNYILSTNWRTTWWSSQKITFSMFQDMIETLSLV